MKISKNIKAIQLNHLLISKMLINKERIITIILLLLIQLNKIISPKKYTAINYKYSYITIKINETGYNKVFSNYKDSRGVVPDHFSTKPNEVHINDINQSEVKSSYRKISDNVSSDYSVKPKY